MADSYRQFLDVIGALASARREIDQLMMLLDYEEQKNGWITSRIHGGTTELAKAQTMIESTFRFLKWVQFADSSNQRDAALLWVKAATALSEPEFNESAD